MLKQHRIQDIAGELREQISAGKFQPYNVLPSRRDLAVTFATTTDTIVKVLTLLQVEGILYKGKGHSLHISDGRERITENGETFREYIKARGRKLEVKQLGVNRIQADPYLARVFYTSPGTSIVERGRCEIVEGVPYRYSKKYYLGELISDEVLEAMQADHTFNVREIIEAKYPLIRIEDVLIARTIVEKWEADLLKAAMGTPILEQWKINVDQNRRVAYVSKVTMNGHYFQKRYDYPPDQEPRSTGFMQRELSPTK